MKIKILGTRGEIEESLPYHSKHSGVLIDGKLLLDLGEKEFLRYKPKWTFITHLHPDHAYFVRRGKQESPETPGKIFVPESCGRKFSVCRKRIRIGGYTIIPIPTHHSKLVRSQAYVVKKGKKSLLYTGDLVWINKKYHRLFDQVDLVITEASFLRKGGLIRKDKDTGHLVGHNGVPNLIDMFKKYSNNILFVHFGSWYYQDMQAGKKTIRQLCKENGVRPLFGYDGMEIDISHLN